MVGNYYAGMLQYFIPFLRKKKVSNVEIEYNEHQDQAEFARHNRFSL